MTATWIQGGALRRRRSFVFFFPAGEAFVAVVFVLGFESRFLYFLFKSLLFFSSCFRLW